MNVASWASINSQTAQWAADNIVNTGNAWISAQIALRDVRLSSKATVRASSNLASVSTAMATWGATRDAIRGQLGLPPA